MIISTQHKVKCQVMGKRVVEPSERRDDEPKLRMDPLQGHWLDFGTLEAFWTPET